MAKSTSVVKPSNHSKEASKKPQVFTVGIENCQVTSRGVMLKLTDQYYVLIDGLHISPERILEKKVIKVNLDEPIQEPEPKQIDPMPIPVDEPALPTSDTLEEMPPVDPERKAIADAAINKLVGKK